MPTCGLHLERVEQGYLVGAEPFFYFVSRILFLAFDLVFRPPRADVRVESALATWIHLRYGYMSM